MAKTITLIYGDGVGKEVVESARKIIDAVGAGVTWECCEAGEKAFQKGIDSGVPQETFDSLYRNKVALKGPLQTPIGYGAKSANVMLRKSFDTYANVRPVFSLPQIQTPFQGRPINFTVVRENLEDLYVGVEYMQTPDVATALKLVTRQGCEKIIRYAFELARSEGRKSVHCITKANILKLTEGMMKRLFEEIAEEYKDIKPHHLLVDNCAHQMVIQPEIFEVVVTTNMNGDILSDLGSALVGGLGIAGSANIGDNVSIFEAVHGSAPPLAGKNVANPTALILSGVMLLRHVGLYHYATQIKKALCKTLSDGYVTKDIPGASPLTTTEFTDKVIDNLSDASTSDTEKSSKTYHMPKVMLRTKQKKRKQTLKGIDIFLQDVRSLLMLGKKLEAICQTKQLKLKLISSRGIKVYPNVKILPECSDFWRCRFVTCATDVAEKDVQTLIQDLDVQKITWTHIEKLWYVDGERAYSLAQGETA